MKFGIFLAPFHPMGENPTMTMERDMQLLEHLDMLGYHEAWVGEHHSGGIRTNRLPGNVYRGGAAERTKHIRLGTGVVSLPYHHPFTVAGPDGATGSHGHGAVCMLGVGPGALTGDALSHVESIRKRSAA